MGLFSDLPVQHPPRVLVMGNHALIQCSACGGSGEGELVWPEDVRPCAACGGAGHMLHALAASPPIATS